MAKGDKKAKENAEALSKLQRMTSAVLKNGLFRLHIGIDPGAEGALGFLIVYEGRTQMATVLDIPTYSAERSGSTKKKVKTKTAFDYEGILEVFDSFRRLNPYQVNAMLEVGQIQAFGRASAYNAGRTMFSYGIWPLFLASRGYTTQEVAPNSWKGKMSVDRADKGISLALARRLFKGEVELTRSGDHNRAEALLLAEYSRRVVHGT